jgi:hypothetical protein
MAKLISLFKYSGTLNLLLTHEQAPQGDGISDFELSIVFYKTINNVDYILQYGIYNVAKYYL